MLQKPGMISNEFFRLATLSYQRELQRHLEDLALKMEKWKAGKITAEELTSYILKFQKTFYKELLRKYNHLPSRALVAQAIVSNILEKKEIPQEVWDNLLPEILFLQAQGESF